MPRDVQPASDQIEGAEILRSLVRSLPKLLLWSIGAGAIAYGLMSAMAPRYESEAQIAITARAGSKLTDPKREGLSAESVAVRMDKEAVNTHVRALLSRELAEEIAGELKLAERVEFNAALGAQDMLSSVLMTAGIGAPRAGETDADRALAAYYKRLEVYPAKESRVIGVQFASSDNQLAAQAANLLVEKYRNLLASRTIEETNEALTALLPKIEALQMESAEAEKAVEQFRGEANIFKGGQAQTGLNEQQLAELTAELSKAKAARSEADARINSAREMLKAGSADAQPDVQKSPLIQNLVQQRVRVERQISELSASLLPGHPRMQQLNADLAGLKKQISAEVTKVIESLGKEAKVAALREDAIDKSLSEIKARIVTASPDEVKLRQLENEARSKRAELERLQAQYEANRPSGDSRSVPVGVEIITKASPSIVPVFPKKTAFSALAAMATFLFGMVGVITQGLFAGVRRGPELMPAAAAPQRRRREIVLEDMPEVGDAGLPASNARPPAAPSLERLSGARPSGTAPMNSAKRASEAAAGPVAAVARRILEKSSGPTGFRTLVTGEEDSIDPSAETLALGRALTAAGKSVIVIDWSTHGAGLARQAGLATEPGIAELLDGKARFEDIVRSVPGTDVHVIAAGPALGNADKGHDADRINLVLDALDEAYDEIVVTGPLDEARALFETIEGRFDAGLVIAPKPRAAGTADEEGRFLGFEVTDMTILCLERGAEHQPSLSSKAAVERLKRLTKTSPPATPPVA